MFGGDVEVGGAMVVGTGMVVGGAEASLPTSGLSPLAPSSVPVAAAHPGTIKANAAMSTAYSKPERRHLGDIVAL
jgi:hypothetical protein